MSKRNSQAAKSAARERIRAQQEAERRREKRKRSVIVGVSIVAVLAIAGGVGYAVMQSNKPGYWEEAADKKLVKPSNTSGEDGTTVTIGKSDKNTVHLYEDPRCPGCAAMEQSIGSAIDKGMKDGDYKLSFTIGTFLDNNLSGEGSKNALSALGAALDVSPDAFLAYKTALYSAKYHPEETKDDFAKDEYLIKVADTVDALKGNKKFQSAVEKGTFDRWALTMSDSFQSAKGVQSTPTIKINDKVVETPKTPDAWKAALKKAGVTK